MVNSRHSSVLEKFLHFPGGVNRFPICCVCVSTLLKAVILPVERGKTCPSQTLHTSMCLTWSGPPASCLGQSLVVFVKYIYITLNYTPKQRHGFYQNLEPIHTRYYPMSDCDSVNCALRNMNTSLDIFLII